MSNGKVSNQEYLDHINNMTQSERVDEMRKYQKVRAATSLWNQIPAEERQLMVDRAALLQAAITNNQPPPTPPAPPLET